MATLLDTYHPSDAHRDPRAAIVAAARRRIQAEASWTILRAAVDGSREEQRAVLDAFPDTIPNRNRPGLRRAHRVELHVVPLLRTLAGQRDPALDGLPQPERVRDRLAQPHSWTPAYSPVPRPATYWTGGGFSQRRLPNRALISRNLRWFDGLPTSCRPRSTNCRPRGLRRKSVTRRIRADISGSSRISFLIGHTQHGRVLLACSPTPRPRPWRRRAGASAGAVHT